MPENDQAAGAGSSLLQLEDQLKALGNMIAKEPVDPQILILWKTFEKRFLEHVKEVNGSVES
jgi:hypothetical protein